MTDFPPRYRDYLSVSQEPTVGAAGPDFRDSAVVVKTRSGSWHAVWQGRDSVLDEFDGTEQDAVDWARQRSTRCWVYSEETDDLVPLDAAEDTDQG